MSSTALTLQKHDALARKYAARIVQANPGMSLEMAGRAADTLAECGLSATEAAVVLDAVYRPNTSTGQGQATRGKWYLEMVRHRFGDRLEKCAGSVVMLRTVIAELEVLTEFRDNVNGMAPFTFSMEEAHLLDQCGLDADRLLLLIHDYQDDRKLYEVRRMIMEAARLVGTGASSTIEGALDFLNRRGNDE